MSLQAFYDLAFQTGAFQAEAETEAWAFQQCVFQADAFQADICDPVEIPVTGGGRLWQRLSVQAYLERVELRKKLEEEIAEPIKEAIEARSKILVESTEADEKAIRAAAEAARIEYQALYMRLLAYQREEARAEEEAIVMTMIAALSE